MNVLSMAGDLSQFLQSGIYYLSSLLLYPVIILLLLLTVWLIIDVGMFSSEWLLRSGKVRRSGDEKGAIFKRGSEDIEEGIVKGKSLIDEGDFKKGIQSLEAHTQKRFVCIFLKGLLRLKDKETGIQEKVDKSEVRFFSINVEKLLQDCEILISKRVERTRMMVRLGPIFGLMGTLIPMGPALRALAQGSVTILTEKLIIAFGTTVVGLLIGSVAYILTVIRSRWYEEDINEIYYICEILFGGEDEVHEKRA